MSISYIYIYKENLLSVGYISKIELCSEKMHMVFKYISNVIFEVLRVVSVKVMVERDDV
jgi:hypothetical protein